MPIVPRPFTGPTVTARSASASARGRTPGPTPMLLSTPRARETIPPALRDGWSLVHDVPAGQVVDAAAALVGAVGDGPIVAWGGGRVIDTAKALAAARGGRVCAVPTTLSGAEMTGGHRQVPGYEDRGRHRPVLVLADPVLMTGQPAAERRRERDERARPRRRGPVRPGPQPGREHDGGRRVDADRRGPRRRRPTRRSGSRSARSWPPTRWTRPATRCTTCSARRSSGCAGRRTPRRTRPCCRTCSSAMRGREPEAIAAFADALGVPVDARRRAGWPISAACRRSRRSVSTPTRSPRSPMPPSAVRAARDDAAARP